MKTTRKMVIILFGMSLIMGSLLINDNTDNTIERNKAQQWLEINPLTSDDQINPEDVFMYLDGNPVYNGTNIYRGIDALNITVVIPESAPVVWSYYNVNLTFSDLTEFEFNLTRIGSLRIFSGEFIPSFENVTGDTLIEILARDSDGNAQEPGGNIDAEFIIMNNAPKLEVVIDSTEVDRVGSISMEFIPSDIEDQVANLEWQVELLNEDMDNPEIIVPRGDLVFDKVYDFDNESFVGQWTINATCWDTEAGEDSQYFDFWVLDNSPVINSIVFMVDEEIVPSNDLAFKRGEIVEISLNVSDIDTPLENLLFKLEALNPGEVSGNIFDNINAFAFVENTSSTFIRNITIPVDMNVGNSNFEFMIFHEADDTFENLLTSETKAIEIENNAPVLSGFEINRIDINQSSYLGDQISILQGEYIGFSVNASDVENDIQYIRVNLLFIDPNTDELIEFNYTAPYEDETTQVRIRSVDLPIGEITVYIYVIDGDGAIGSFISPYTFDIKEENTTVPMIWLMFVVGLILGGAVSIGVLNSTITRQAERKVLLKLEGSTQEISSRKQDFKTDADKDESKRDTAEKSEEIKEKSQKKKVKRRL